MLRRRDNDRLRDLQQAHMSAAGVKLMRLVDVVSVGSVQSGERRIVLFSTVRHARLGSRRSIGIAGCVDTVYVALTRAREQLIIVGDLHHLSMYSPWHKIASFFTTYDATKFHTRQEFLRIYSILAGHIDAPPPQQPPPPPPRNAYPDDDVY